MVVDAEQRRAELLASNDSDGVLFKLRKDPRVTAVGAHLRRWSIDELPQLFNVFLGHMSLVGPRPALPDEAAKYAEHVRRRLVVKPGLTGLWQVNGRSDLSWDESVRLDLRYVGELVVRARPADHVEDDLGARAGVGGLLMTLSDADAPTMLRARLTFHDHLSEVSLDALVSLPVTIT